MKAQKPYTDFDTMSFDIIDHVKLTGDRIVRINDQNRMMFGFATEDGNREWVFRLVDVKARSIKSSEDIFWTLIVNNLGRDFMANAFCHSDDYNVLRHIKKCRECFSFFAILEVMDS